MAAGPDGAVFAGTDKGGLVYRIDAKGKGFVLYQAPQAEVRRLEVTPDGLYVGTSAPTNRKRGGGTASNPSSSTSAALDKAVKPTAVSKTPKAEKTDAETTAVSEGKSGSESKESAKSSSASAPSAPSSGENSVYRIASDGTVREVFREKALVLSLLRQDGRFLVGTGMEGQLFEVDEATRERGEIARLDHGQILCLCRRKDGSIVLGTGDPGKLYVLQDRYAAKGTIISEVLDAKLISKWGALRWQAETPEGTAVTRGRAQRQRRRAGRDLERLVGRADRRGKGDDRRSAGAFPPVPRDAEGRREVRRFAGGPRPDAALCHHEPGAGGDEGRGARPERGQPRQPEEAEVQVVRHRRQRGRADLRPLCPQGRLEQLGAAGRRPRQDGLRVGHARLPRRASIS